MEGVDMEGDPAGPTPPIEGTADPDSTLEDEVVRLRSELDRAVVAHLVGPPRWLTGSARWARKQAASPDTRTRIADNADGLRIAVVVLGLVALFFTGIEVLAVLVVGILVALSLWAIEGVKRGAAPPGAAGKADADTASVGTPRP